MGADQPVTPDREALIRAGTLALVSVTQLPEWMQVPALGRHMMPVAELVVDALLPLLTDALDRARQQGRDDAAAAIEAHVDKYVPDTRPGMNMNKSRQSMRRHLQLAVRLARGGPNRKDET